MNSAVQEVVGEKLRDLGNRTSRQYGLIEQRLNEALGFARTARQDREQARAVSGTREGFECWSLSHDVGDERLDRLRGLWAEIVATLEGPEQ